MTTQRGSIVTALFYLYLLEIENNTYKSNRFFLQKNC